MSLGVALLVSLGSVQAQSNVSQMLEDAAKRALLGAVPVSAEERQEVAEALRPMLEKRLTFREDGVTSAAHHLNGEVIYIEWMGLKVEVVRKDALNAADQANGITRRYRIVMTSTSHRVWKKSLNAWSEWKPTGYPLFFSGITVEERNGILEARTNEHGTFMPGPVRSMGASAQPVSPSQGLPPGMERSK